MTTVQACVQAARTLKSRQLMIKAFVNHAEPTKLLRLEHRPLLIVITVEAVQKALAMPSHHVKLAKQGVI